jgi:peptidoglycan/xylan/chitin deacetylase (PgdA/CDA1 family)
MMRVVAVVIVALPTLALAASAAQKADGRVIARGISAAQSVSFSTAPAAPLGPIRVASGPVAEMSDATSVTRPAGEIRSDLPTQLAQTTSAPTGIPAPTPTANVGSAATAVAPTSNIPACDKPDAMGLSRIVEIDTTGGPGFGFEHFKQYDFLRDKEVVLTFDDGPWPQSTPAVLKALADECLKATFFEIGEHAMWHPEITKQVIEAGMTVGTHTWSHKDLARNPYAKDIEKAEREIEMGNSAVHMAAGGAPIAPFFRFPDLQHAPKLFTYLGERNIAIFSTDIDSRDFKMHKPEQVIKSVMSQLEKRGKGIILMHDFHRNTAEALPELLHQLKGSGYKVVHMVPKGELTTLPKYDEMVTHQGKLSSNNTRPKNVVVRTARRLVSRPELIDTRYRTRTDPARRSPTHDHARKGVSPNQVLAAKHRGKLLPIRPLSAHGSPTPRHPRG